MCASSSPALTHTYTSPFLLLGPSKQHIPNRGTENKAGQPPDGQERGLTPRKNALIHACTQQGLFSVGAHARTMASFVGHLCWQRPLRWMEILWRGHTGAPRPNRRPAVIYGVLLFSVRHNTTLNSIAIIGV